jgi:quinol monooxygenase YgiN
MTMRRRAFVFLAGAALVGPFASRLAGQAATKGPSMYGLIGKMTAVAGQRDALASILLEGTEAMPGCLSYIVAADPTEADALWITEVWDSQASHQASLQLPGVKAAIARGRPLIAGFGTRVETSPIGGTGLGPGRRGA